MVKNNHVSFTITTSDTIIVKDLTELTNYMYNTLVPKGIFPFALFVTEEYGIKYIRIYNYYKVVYFESADQIAEFVKKNGKETSMATKYAIIATEDNFYDIYLELNEKLKAVSTYTGYCSYYTSNGYTVYMIESCE